MKVETEIGINTDAKIIVHNKDGSGVLVRVSCIRVIGNGYLRLIRFFFIRMKYYSPPGEEDKSSIELKDCKLKIPSTVKT